MLSNVTGKQGYTLRSTAEVCWASQLPGSLRTWEFEVKPNGKQLKPSPLLLNKLVGGSGSRGEITWVCHQGDLERVKAGGCIWEARCRWWAFWRCSGPIIETPMKECAHLMTPMKLWSLYTLLQIPVWHPTRNLQLAWSFPFMFSQVDACYKEICIVVLKQNDLHLW